MLGVDADWLSRKRGHPVSSLSKTKHKTKRKKQKDTFACIPIFSLHIYFLGFLFDFDSSYIPFLLGASVSVVTLCALQPHTNVFMDLQMQKPISNIYTLE